jgi:hypothetical protein
VAGLGLLIYLQFSDDLPDYMQMSGSEALRAQHPKCALAEVSRDHIFVAASMWEGGALTGLTIGSPPFATKLVRVSVARGDKPISVFLSGYGVIWDFAGDVERVRRVVAITPASDRTVGVVGIPKDRVDFPDLRGCELLAEVIAPDEERAVRAKALAAIFGRRPDHAAYKFKAIRVSLPDATFDAQQEEPPVSTPGGPRVLDPGHVVSALAVARPDILPGEAGLTQLAATGKIRRPHAEEVGQFIAGASRPYQSKLSPDFRLAAKFDYAITGEITLPPALYNMTPKRFLVLAGVPAPRGDSSQVCIAQMDGFRVNSVDKCLGHAHQEGIERLRKLPAVESVAQCRLLVPPASASLEAVSVYEPGTDGNLGLEQVAARLAASRAGKTPAPASIDVRVEKPGDVVLVLSTYNPATWRVSASPGTRIVGVVLIGYYTSVVEGIALDTPVVAVDVAGRAGRAKPEPACAGLQSYLGTGYGGGPDALAFDRQVQALTGRPLDGLRGAYHLMEAVIR